MSGEGIGIGSGFEQREAEPNMGTAVDGFLTAFKRAQRQETTASAIAHMSSLSGGETETLPESDFTVRFRQGELRAVKIGCGRYIFI